MANGADNSVSRALAKSGDWIKLGLMLGGVILIVGMAKQELESAVENIEENEFRIEQLRAETITRREAEDHHSRIQDQLEDLIAIQRLTSVDVRSLAESVAALKAMNQNR